MFGDISAWFYSALGGIHPDPDEPGFKHTTIQPRPVGDLRWVRADHASPYGLIRSHWTIDDEVFELSVTVPANASATVVLPTASVAAVSESGMPVAAAAGVLRVESSQGSVLVRVGSGDYRFRVRR